MLTPIRAPRANAVAERVVRTFRNECLDHLIPVNEGHLRSVLREFVGYYNAERPHRGLGLETPDLTVRPATGGVRSRAVLGGLHHVLYLQRWPRRSAGAWAPGWDGPHHVWSLEAVS